MLVANKMEGGLLSDYAIGIYLQVGQKWISKDVNCSSSSPEDEEQFDTKLFSYLNRIIRKLNIY